MVKDPHGLPELYVVRQRDHERYHRRPPFSEGRMIAVFARREAAEAFLAEREETAKRSGDIGPLRFLPRIGALWALTEFEPGVFQDWLEDAGIPEPPFDFWAEEHSPWWDWLDALSSEQAVHLCRGLHNLCYYDLIRIALIEGETYPAFLRDNYETGRF
jgi:hypothetical protein